MVLFPFCRQTFRLVWHLEGKGEDFLVTALSYVLCWWFFEIFFFFLPFCFISPCQRPLSAAHPSWPQLVPTVYQGCHRGLGRLNKGGSVSFVPSKIVSAPMGTKLSRKPGEGVVGKVQSRGNLTTHPKSKGKESEKERRRWCSRVLLDI